MEQIKAALRALLERQRPGVEILAERELGQELLFYGRTPAGEVELLLSGQTPDSASILPLGSAPDREQALELIEQDLARRSAPGQGRSWQCLLCSFVYEEALGHPETGVPPGTAWEAVPDDWCCPECGAAKEDFMMVEIAG